MKELSLISNTGYWNGETAHIHHVHSELLATTIATFLRFRPNLDKRIYDLGCGLGHYLKYLADYGFTDLVGFEGDPPKQKVFNNIVKQDLTHPIRKGFENKGHVICLEVGEHIPAEYQEQLLKNIDFLCEGYLILSWAVRGQAGFGHVNCLDNHEVIEIMEKYGFKYLHGYSQDARVVIDDTTPWFKNTIMIFSKWK